MQRLNAIFSFLENSFAFEEKYFDILEFTFAKQLADEGVFKPVDKELFRLSRKACADVLDYQLAVTIYPVNKEEDITEVFGRINSSGKHLSPQEKRQAGMTNSFAEMVRKIAVELRGDVSAEVLLLSQMPEISINSENSNLGYKIQAEDTLWCKQGVMSISQLRDSEDEQMIADIAASVLRNKPLPVDTENLDRLYNPTTEEFGDIEEALAVYKPEKLTQEIKRTFSVLKEVIEAIELKSLRKIVNRGSSNPIKSAFYTIFMAFFDLIVRQERYPADPKGIMDALDGLQERLALSKNYKTTRNRERNIDQTKGLIEKYFAKKEISVFGHGAGLALDFENSLNRSRLESPRYEFKQGILQLDKDRKEEENLISKIVATICGIANLGPQADGYIFIGVADAHKDADRIQKLDKIKPIEVNGKYVVGIGREASLKKLNLEEFVKRLVSKIRASELSDPLKTQLYYDTILYKEHSVIRITIPAQKDVSFVGQTAFTRINSSTTEVSGPQLIAVYKLFQR
jgi:Putative DNA-binding domain